MPRTVRMVGFGTKAEEKKRTVHWYWPDSLDLVDSGPISTTELWTIKEKIDSENATVKRDGGEGIYHVELAGGEKLYVATFDDVVYFIRKVAITNIVAGSKKHIFEN